MCVIEDLLCTRICTNYKSFFPIFGGVEIIVDNQNKLVVREGVANLPVSFSSFSESTKIMILDKALQV